jgi:hypothetical protein
MLTEEKDNYFPEDLEKQSRYRKMTFYEQQMET